MRRRRGSSGVSGRCCCDRTEPFTCQHTAEWWNLLSLHSNIQQAVSQTAVTQHPSSLFTQFSFYCNKVRGGAARLHQHEENTLSEQSYKHKPCEENAALTTNSSTLTLAMRHFCSQSSLVTRFAPILHEFHKTEDFSVTAESLFLSEIKSKWSMKSLFTLSNF